MATRFYPDPTNAPSVSPAYDSGWSDTTQAVRRKLVIDAPGDNASTDFTVSETSGGIYFVLAVQFVSEPLDSISAACDVVKLVCRCSESSAKSDAQLRFVIRRCDEDGSNPSNLHSSHYTDNTEFDDGGLVNRIAGSYNANGGNLSQGDRFIVEVGVYFANTKTDSYSGTVNVTDNHATTDLPENDTETAAYNSWIETGDTFTEATGTPATIKLGPMFAFA